MSFFKHHDDSETTPQPDLNIKEDKNIKYIPIQKNKSASSVIGQVTQVDVLSPAAISIDSDYPNPSDTVLINETGGTKSFYRPYYIVPAGYPRNINIDTLQNVIDHGWIDCAIDIHPRPNGEADRDLRHIQTILESNSQFQSDHGMQFQLRDNLLKSEDIEVVLSELQKHDNRLYDVIITFLVYGKNHNELDQRCHQFADEMDNNGFTVQPVTHRVKSGFLETVPLGVPIATLNDMLRMVDRFALSQMDLAQNASGEFNEGIPFARNLKTGQEEYLNVFGTKEKSPDNYNMFIMGQSGSGKSAANKIKIYREVTMLGYHHRSIDPDGEYVKLAHTLHQLNLDITPDSDFCINPCSLSVAERELDDFAFDKDELTDSEYNDLRNLLNNKNINRSQIIKRNGKHYLRYVPILQKINQIEDFINQIFIVEGNEQLNFTERACLEKAISEVFNDLGITNDPASLYQGQAGSINGVWYENMPKPEPTLSMIDQKLRELFYNKQKEHSPIRRLLAAMQAYLKTGTKPLFDGQTNFGRGHDTKLGKYYYVNFNISELSGSFKHIAYYVLTQLLWNDWIKNPEFAAHKKVLDADEILQEIDNDSWASFMELVVRQCRKYNASLTTIAQDLDRVEDNNKMRALISNSQFFFFTHIKQARREAIQHAFQLNEGVMDQLCGETEKGEGVMMNRNKCLWVRTDVTPEELTFVESNVSKQRELEKEATDRFKLANKELRKSIIGRGDD